MSHLNLPGTKHPLGVLDDFIERKLFPEVIPAGEIGANLVHRDRGKDGATREIGLHALVFVLLLLDLHRLPPSAVSCVKATGRSTASWHRNCGKSRLEFSSP